MTNEERQMRLDEIETDKEAAGKTFREELDDEDAAIRDAHAAHVGRVMSQEKAVRM